MGLTINGSCAIILSASKRIALALLAFGLKKNGGLDGCRFLFRKNISNSLHTTNAGKLAPKAEHFCYLLAANYMFLFQTWRYISSKPFLGSEHFAPIFISKPVSVFEILPRFFKSIAKGGWGIYHQRKQY